MHLLIDQLDSCSNCDCQLFILKKALISAVAEK